MAVPLSSLVLLRAVYGAEQILSWAAASCRSSVGLKDEEFIVHVLGFKSPISVCYVKFPFRKDRLIWFSCPVNMWVMPWAAIVPGALHMCVRVCS